MSDMEMVEVSKNYFRITKKADVSKSIDGSMSAAREFDPQDLGPEDDILEGQERDGKDVYMPNRGQCLGDARVLPSRSNTGLVDSKSLTTAGDNIYAVDPFLHGDGGTSGRVGGEDRGFAPVDPNHGSGGGSYLYRETGMPAPARGLNYRASEDSGISEAGTFRPAKPDAAMQIGGTPVSDYITKAVDRGDVMIERDEPRRADVVKSRKSSIFKDVICRGTQDGVEQAAQFLGSVPEGEE